MEFIRPRGLAKRHAGSDTEQKRFQSTQLSLLLRDTGTPVPAPGITVWDFNSHLPYTSLQTWKRPRLLVPQFSQPQETEGKRATTTFPGLWSEWNSKWQREKETSPGDLQCLGGKTVIVHCFGDHGLEDLLYFCSWLARE